MRASIGFYQLRRALLHGPPHFHARFAARSLRERARLVRYRIRSITGALRVLGTMKDNVIAQVGLAPGAGLLEVEEANGKARPARVVKD